MLDTNYEPYRQEVLRITSKQELTRITSHLEKDIKDGIEHEYITASAGCIQTWRNRVEQFKENEEYIKACIFNYEKIPGLLDYTQRRVVMQCYNSLYTRFDTRRPTGLKAVIFRAMQNGYTEIEQFDEELNALTERAKLLLKTQ